MFYVSLSIAIAAIKLIVWPLRPNILSLGYLGYKTLNALYLTCLLTDFESVFFILEINPSEISKWFS
jgi:hypothetical protein